MPFFSTREHTQYSSVPLDDHTEPEGLETDTDDELLQCEYVQEEEETSETRNDREIPPSIVLPSNSLTYCQSIRNLLDGRSVGIGIFLSVLALVAFSSILSGLGYYSLFLKTPLPYIDKSYRAFAIPNHKSSLNYEAFTVARSQNSSHSFQLQRFKRDIGTFSTNLGNIPKQLLWSNDRLYSDDISLRNPELKSSHLFLEKRSVRNDDKSRDIKKRSSDMISVVAYQYHVRWKMQVVFMATGNGNEPEHEKDNIFTKERLQTIHSIEKSILNHPDFKDFCFKDRYVLQSDPALKSIYGCAPLNSLLTYFFPSQDSNGKFHYDGLGSNMAEIESAIKLAMTSDHFYYFVDEKVNKTFHKSRLLRTEVLFGAPLRGYSNPYVKSKEQTEKFKSFVIKYIDILSKASTDKVQVLFGGNEIFDYEVDYTFWNDLRLAIISAISIAAFMMIFTSSLWLTFWGIVSICLSFPLAFFFYRVVCGIRALGILNGVAAFVIIGIGVDDVFVFINIYRQSSPDLTTYKRIRHTLITAGKATFFTSFTTSAAFAANIASSIPAVHQFGLFMSLIVACCWITVIMIMPPALFIWQYTFARCENYLMSLCMKPLKRLKMCVKDLPSDIAQFVHGTGSSLMDNNTPDAETEHQATVCTEITGNGQDNTDDDDDLPLLMLEDPMEYYFQAQYDSDDVPLLTGDDSSCQQVSPESSSPVHARNEMYPCGFLQSFVYYIIARPVVKVRWIILVLSVLFLIISIGLATLLHPATKPPQFFNKDTNLQKLLDLKANFSVIDEISCSKCSAVYDVPVSSSHMGYPVTHTPYIPSEPFDKFTFKHNKMPTLPPFLFSKIPEATVKTNKDVTVNPKTMYPPWKVTQALTKLQMSTTKRPIVKSKSTTTWRLNPSRHAMRTHEKKTTTTTQKSLIYRGPYFNSQTEQQTTKPLIITPSKTVSESRSVPLNVNLCDNNDCTRTQDRPLLETGATVYVVFGIKHIDKSEIEVGHVMDESVGKVEFDKDFSDSFKIPKLPLTKENIDIYSKLCKICKVVASHTELIRNGSAQCFPFYGLLQVIPECRDLPKQEVVYGRLPPAHAVGGLTRNHTALLWWAFAFESTTSKGQSYFSAFQQYLKWEKLIQEIKDTVLKDSPHIGLNSMFQTSEFWQKVAMEVVAVNSAIYGLVLSLVICLAAVAIFTGHIVLLLIIFLSIVEMICLVLGIFYMVGWEIGGVEAVSLSILVGSSVDYCMHLVEGYLIAGKALPYHCKEKKSKGRQWRTKAALSHIGVSIISSALTTIVASVPLTQTIIQPFAKFGQIVAINTSVCIVYSLTVCTSLLAAVAPAYFVPTWKSFIKAFFAVFVTVGVIVLALFISVKAGAFITGPNGEPLFE